MVPETPGPDENERGFNPETVRRLRAITPEQWLEGARRVAARERRLANATHKTVFAATLDDTDPSAMVVGGPRGVIEESSGETT